MSSNVHEIVFEILTRYGMQVLGALAILAVGVIVARWLGGAADRRFQKTHMEPPMRILLVRVIRVIVLVMAFLVALDKFGFSVAPLLKDRRVQLIFSGKAHPADQAGKAVVALLIETIRQWPESIVFLEDYDIGLGRLLTRGCDVWLNTPRRPMEASGTSGMKAAMNGTLNLSILDGWWPEGCEHGVTGWAIGDESVGPDQDTRDLRALYATLERDVLPAWANVGRWTGMMRASIRMGVERFSSDRMVKEYFERLYTEP